MKEQYNFSLDPRLLACAKMIRPKSNIADVGTDHAYLPIYLAKNNLINHAIALDLNPGPLLNAKNNIEKHNLTHIIETRLSNGLDNINKNESDDIVIAGMGGEIISLIIANATWLKNSSKHLILQPMSKDEILRFFLKNENYKIIKEIAVVSSKKVYSVMLVEFSNNPFEVHKLYPYIGKLIENITPSTVLYIQKKIKSLEKQLLGYKLKENLAKYNELISLIKELKKLIGV